MRVGFLFAPFMIAASLAALALSGCGTGADTADPSLAAHAADGQASTAIEGPAQVSLLSQERTATDALPPEFWKSPMAGRIADPQSTRLAFQLDEKRYYAARGVDRAICLIAISGSDGDYEAVMTCPSESVLASGAIYLNEHLSDGTMNVIGIVPDGFDLVRLATLSGPVTNNVFAIEHAPPVGILELTGPAGSRRVGLELVEPSDGAVTTGATTSTASQ